MTGATNVGGVLGENVWVDDSDKKDTTIANNVLTATASVTGTTSVGAIIGDNSQMQTDGGTIKNNFWPTSAGNVVGSGMGSASTETTITTANSSYRNDGTLTTPITSSDGTSTISNLGDALEKVTGGSAPEAMRVTVTYNNGGHGTAPGILWKSPWAPRLHCLPCPMTAITPSPAGPPATKRIRPTRKSLS